MDYKFIVMCGGTYDKWDRPKHLTELKGEPLVARTIRLLRENGVEDIAISSNSALFEQFGVPVLHHYNPYTLPVNDRAASPWLDAFYPMESPVCYIFGDVVFSPEALKTIIGVKTKNIEFFASSPPFSADYVKSWAEPFAFKVVATDFFRMCVDTTRKLAEENRFNREPISWELWQVIKCTQLNRIDYSNYFVINDWTCDVDDPEDLKKIEEVMP